MRPGDQSIYNAVPVLLLTISFWFILYDIISSNMSTLTYQSKMNVYIFVTIIYCIYLFINQTSFVRL